MAGRVPAVDEVVAESARRADPYLRRAERPQVFEVRVDGGGFLAGVGEDRKVEVELGVGFTGQEEQGGALYAGTEV